MASHAAGSDESRIRELHTGMAEALDADRRKVEINDAKMRAVAQRVDYDQFCHMVAGAHLKPVKPLDKDAASRDFSYFVMPGTTALAPPPTVDPLSAPAALRSAPASPGGGGRAAEASTSAGFKVPKSGLEFHKVWRRQCKTQPARAAYMRLVDTQLIPTVFQSEFEPDVLDGIVAALAALLQPAGLAERAAKAAEAGGAEAEELGEDVHLAASWLQMLPEVNKYELALEFCADGTREAAGEIIASLRSKGLAKLPRGSEWLQQELRELLSGRALDETAAKYV
ncbi:hypothetical protein T492DRAFT_1039769 [Pavlovales sp. CCMP2436]|nr:hypothetical protein T492DRAFT_1039769 [Pavlovales sp. CCMP2436]|eukprot:CAMPEP_0179874940 /NCGR_PEP_ID=MMETSP0982-20121206/23199_1 /TAXON_ID=483367 /ORGANISM="non described non described, Strain CCMP 2436" /LENGTH=282 /DNA_ID=CAMNT_0021766855 /DNA_START=8 /DNA_END=856 /DNA_ORIENTATION=-